MNRGTCQWKQTVILMARIRTKVTVRQTAKEELRRLRARQEVRDLEKVVLELE